jgi:hypothetical protein
LKDSGFAYILDIVGAKAATSVNRFTIPEPQSLLGVLVTVGLDVVGVEVLDVEDMYGAVSYGTLACVSLLRSNVFYTGSTVLVLVVGLLATDALLRCLVP